MDDIEKLNQELLRKREENKKLNTVSSGIDKISKDIENRLNNCRFCGNKLIGKECICEEFKMFTLNEAEEELNEKRIKEDKKARFLQDEKDKKSRIKENILENFHIPARYKGVDLFSDWNIDRSGLKNYINSIKQNVNDGYGLVLKGDEGTGKTRLSFAIALYIIKNIKTLTVVRYKLHRLLKLALKDEDKYDEVIEKELLIIDEIGLKQLTDWEMQIVYDIIDYRNEERLYTIVTTNGNNEELEKFISSRSYKRLVESCEFIVFDGDSRRDKK